ncbi:hypothetical protein PQ610_00705 [Tardisphaera miroshnichenkoae]
MSEDPEEALKQLQQRKDELTKRIEELQEQHERGLISDQDYEARLKELEREVVEVMDRIVQMEFLTGYRRFASINRNRPESASGREEAAVHRDNGALDVACHVR